MFQRLRTSVRQQLVNLPARRIDRKVVVVESDDWGGIRMPSREVYETLLRRGIPVDRSPYCRYDTLATQDDLSALFDVLCGVRDAEENAAVVTANCVVANPDFRRIRETDFTQFAYEPFTSTLLRYPQHETAFALWREGMERGVFRPQFHGREHLHVARWMAALKAGLSETRLAFDLESFGIGTTVTTEARLGYLSAFDARSRPELSAAEEVFRSGTRLFRDLLGYSATSFVAPNYTWPTALEATMMECGIRFIQGTSVQREPLPHSGHVRRTYRFTGQRSGYGPSHLVRNAFFEPSLKPSADWIGICLAGIDAAFRWHTPAIVCTHRLNYVGGLDVANRDRGLGLLERLLRTIVARWPDVRFMSSDAAGELVLGEGVEERVFTTTSS